MTGGTDLGRRRLRALGDLASGVTGHTRADLVGPAAVAALAAHTDVLPFVRVHLTGDPDAEVPPAGPALVLPLGTAGVLVAGLPPRTDGGPDDEPDDAGREFAGLVAAVVTAALAAAAAHERAGTAPTERAVAATLQRSVLGPVALPSGFAVRYEPADGPLAAGGDWYDVIALPGGGTGLVVGDCVGRGVTAAAVMGRLRDECRELLLRRHGPAAVLTALDGVAATLAGGVGATVLCARLDPGTGRLVHSSAGHPPGIVVGPDGKRSLLDGATAPPLAVEPGLTRPERTVTLVPGATVLLFTDGLVRRAGEVIDTGIAASADILAAGRHVPERALAARLVGPLGPRTGEDDVAVLLYRHAAPGTARFSRSFRADPMELAPARAALTEWLREHSVPRDVIERAVLAACEAWTNAAEHGYRLDPGQTVHCAASLSGRDLEIAVSDLGSWRPPGPPSDRGRGMTLMRALCDEVDLDIGPGGTTVRLVLAVPE